MTRWWLSSLVLCAVACTQVGPPGVTQVAQVQQAYTAGTSVNLSGATNTCNVCAGSDAGDYNCPVLGAPWDAGVFTFTDPSPTNAAATSVTLGIWGTGCSNGGGTTVALNGTSLGTYAPPDNCVCDTCFRTDFSLTSAAGLPGYVYGGTNTIQLTPFGNANPCIDRIDVTVGGANVTSLSPTTGPTNGGITITFTGTDFPAGVSSITFGGTAATNVTRVSATSLTATLPAHAMGTVSVVVVFTGGATITLANAFTYGGSAAPTTTTLATSGTPTLYGQLLTLTATVTSASGTPSGNVVFWDGPSNLGNANLNGAGQATLGLTTLTSGTHSLTAVYGATASYLTSTSSALLQTVNKADSTTMLTSSSNPAIVGTTPTLSAHVTAVAPGGGTPAGTVTFLDGTATLGSSSLNGSGIATLVTPLLSTGVHPLTAQYASGINHNQSSGTLNLTISPDAVMVTLASSANPSVYGANVTFTANVTTSTTGGQPTGTVTFKEGTTTLGTGTLNGSGVATFSTNALLGGTHMVIAQYGGDMNHAAGSSAALGQVVNKASTTTANIPSANPSVTGQSVTFTATVTSSAGTPTGTVTFTEGATTLGSTALSGGAAAFSTPFLTVATHPVVATYGGDGNFAGSTAAAVMQVVNKSPTSTALTSSANPSAENASVTFTATVTPTAPGMGTPQGTVTFKEGGATLGTATLSGGLATFSTATLSLGAHPLTADYGGDPSYLASSSATFVQNVTNFTDQVALTASPNPSTFGQTVTFTATVTGSGATPTGAIAFLEGTNALANVPLDGAGVATHTVSTLGAGMHTVVANYGGSTLYLAASASVVLTVNQAPTTTTLVTAPNPQGVGQPVELSATVSSPVPGFTGTVEFFDGATSLGSEPLDGSGVATHLTSTLAAGGHAISAQYSGDADHSGSTSAAVNQTIGLGGSGGGGGSHAGGGKGGGGGGGSSGAGCSCASGAGGGTFGLGLLLGLAVLPRLRRRRA